MADDSTQIQTNAMAPQEASSDAGMVRQHPIPGQIQGDRYAAARAGAKNKNRGLRFSKIIPAGPMPDQQGQSSQGGDFTTGGDGF